VHVDSEMSQDEPFRLATQRVLTAKARRQGAPLVRVIYRDLRPEDVFQREPHAA
jgi:hypothetical protein